MTQIPQNTGTKEVRKFYSSLDDEYLVVDKALKTFSAIGKTVLIA